MLSWRPISHFGKRAIGSGEAHLDAIAAEQWTMAPAMRRYIPPARFLPHHLERIRATQFGSIAEVVRGFRGDYDAFQNATVALRLKDVDLIDGTLYAGGAADPLRARRRRLPIYARPKASMAQATIFESWMGNRWFGMWLLNDCLTYQLAADSGQPVRTQAASTHHQKEYARQLQFRAQPIADMHFDELVVFRDQGNNEGKQRRADALKARLRGSGQFARHPGVFLLRGQTGDRRLLVNEREIAEQFAKQHGFRILDPSSATLAEVIDACAGAGIVAGVEGSHLTHGLQIMSNDAALFVIQPPDRVVSILKVVTDRQGQAYAFVVGQGSHDAFSVDWDDVSRTLDLVVT
ncbi:MAG: glycosyltransferase family 61 protein [Pseudorhizobium sp.]